MTGWCPRHDQVFTAADGLCPKCGTALVADDAPTRDRPIVIEDAAQPSDEATVASEPPRRRPFSSVAGIVAAVAVAFVVGLVFPEPKSDESPSTSSRDVSADITVGVTRTAVGVPLRLESFTQRGRRIVARFTVGDVPGLDLGRLRSATVVVRTGDGGEISDQVAVRTTVTGFIIEAELLQTGRTPVLGLRIDTLIFSAGGEAIVPLDLRGAWPATRSTAPRAKRVSAALPLGKNDPSFTVTGIVGWADRLELGMTGGAPAGRDYRPEFTMSYGDVEIGGELHGGSGSFTLTFRGVPKQAREVYLRVSVSSLTVFGLWEWSFV